MTGGTVRCPRCGNENPDGNRFCGMCGATLLSAPAIAETATQRAASAGTVAPSPTPVTVVPPVEPPPPPVHEAREAHDSDSVPIISGPSFLGLSDPNPRKRATMRADSHDSRGSRNVDYLLEDEPEDGGGAGKIVVILFFFALAAGFGYMTVKNHGVGWVAAMLSKPAAPAAQQAPTDNGSNTPATTPANPAPESQSSPPNQTPQAAAAQPPAASDNSKPVNPAPATPTASAPANHEDSHEPSKPASAANPPAAEDEDASGEDNTPPAAAAKPAKPKAAVETPSPKPHAAVVPAKPVDPVSEAQKYIYGRGAPQDCDRGLKLLKPAANGANPKAMIEMGALYSAGLCTPRDLPTAYRWFAIALRKDPENDAVQHDLQKLWSEMTQPERQLAIKLSQ
jgi:hypothetical protein